MNGATNPLPHMPSFHAQLRLHSSDLSSQIIIDETEKIASWSWHIM